MCGICGKISFDKNNVDKELIRRMTSTLKHRGPDDYGIYISEGVGLGHRRLSIIDLSFAGHQPMSNEDGAIWIIYNGEIYNFKELRAGLEANGHRFKSRTDTEVILHLYEEQGIECVKQLRGMFAFAIWDREKERLFLARDRLGMKPLFYAFRGNNITFASEIRTLLEDKEIERSINFVALHHYLTYSYVPAPDTIFSGIKKLLPGNIFVKEKDYLKIEPYWRLNFNRKVYLPEEEYSQRILELLKEAVKIRLISDVPLGAFLSGGIDSSIVVALMSQLSDSPVKTFSIGFEEQSFNELEYARVVAKKFSTEHHEFIVRPEALEILPRLIELFGEPFADTSAIPTYYLSKMTRGYVTVALNGDGGDEAFAGYDRYLAHRLRKYFKGLFVFRPLFRILPESTHKKDKIRRLKKFTEILNLSEEKAYASLMSILDNKLKDNLYTDEFKNIIGDADSHVYILDAYKEAGTNDFLDATLYVDTFTYLPHDLLVKVDIASMANSLEARSPFIDHKVLEFVAQIPSSLKIKGLRGKYILKKTFSKVLPDEILKRKKAGFGVPVGKWFRNELRDYAYEILLDDRTTKRGYFKRESVRKLLDEHVSGRTDHGHRIWSLIVLELWHRRFVD